MSTAATTVAVPSVRTAKPAAWISLGAGLVLIFVAGFSNSTTLHNIAHDTRHVMAFPCH